MFSATIFLGPCLGPLIGGWIGQYAGWRWIYWVLFIFTGFCFGLTLFTPETLAPVLLRRKAAALRKATGDGKYRSLAELDHIPFAETLRIALLRPIVMLFAEPVVLFMSFYLSFVYSLLYLLFFAFPIALAEIRGFSGGLTGVTFISIIIGIVVALALMPYQEKIYSKATAHGSFPEARLFPMLLGSLALPVALFIFTFTGGYSWVNFMGPCVAGALFGFSMILIYVSANSYIIDSYSDYAASAIAAKTVMRSLVGAAVPLYVNQMFANMGFQWAGLLLALVSVAIAPIPFVFYVYGYLLVTGTSQNGIGFDTARAIAKYAGLVIITGYNVERLQLSADAIRKEVPTANVRTVVLDLSSLAAVRKAAEEINTYSEPLHVLIHNAAHTSLVYSITVDDIESQMAVNHVSPFLLTKLLLPKLLASNSPTWLPRVVVVSSEIQGMGPGIDLSAVRKPAPGSAQETDILLRYHEAKSAGLLTALGLAKRGAGKLQAYSLHPGTIFTNVQTKEAVVPVLQAIGVLKEDGQPNLESAFKWKTIPQGAATTVVAAFDPRLNDKSGSFLEDCVEANEKRHAMNSDPAKAEKLWKVTEEIVGEEFVI
ncbi:hypothetical protein B0H19DRAFT_1264487 [Mycena capillaripes]|nr:hypothetical protein B0H19DRAFT_1264487 [Mycena capillaripes]